MQRGMHTKEKDLKKNTTVNIQYSIIHVNRMSSLIFRNSMQEGHIFPTTLKNVSVFLYESMRLNMLFSSRTCSRINLFIGPGKTVRNQSDFRV